MTNYRKGGTDQWILGVNERLARREKECGYKTETGRIPAVMTLFFLVSMSISRL